MFNKMMTRMLATLAAGSLYATAAYAQDVVTLKFAHVFPATHWLWKQGGEIFTKEVEQASGGKVKFEVFPAAQLGKEVISNIGAGIASSGIVAPSYEAWKVPLSSVLELPGLHASSCEGTAKYWHMAREGGALYEQEYKQLGLRVLYVNLLPPYSLMTTGKKVEKLEDVAGLKIRANGPAMDKTARALGAVGVRVTSPELFDALSRGTVDGALWPIGSTIESGLEKLLKYTVVPSKLGGGTTFFAISESAWQGLDEETRKVMLQAGQKAQQHLCKYLDDLEVEVRDKLVADGNLTISTLSAEEAARWDDALTKVADGWAKEMEGTGRPGAELLKAAREAPTQF